jgi:Tol biopolymer transport system component/tRNA A-37 threonylcarbamoyl transferase component Bud32
MDPERWHQIDKLLGEALELDASLRSAFLDQACAGDRELRGKIDALLAAHEQAESFIETPALAATAQVLAQTAQSLARRQLGHYQVLALLGAGGMGSVWKAKDTRLGREVAIKTLPGEFDRQRDRLARFEREAKLLASLNHPNIAAIHGLEEDRGTRFLVLELVEGDTLADRLRPGAIPLKESLKLARQISDALDAAHEKGVIHRDLKPANIKITDDGTVKVLDFGLAKAFASDDVHTDASGSLAKSIGSTEQGMILGTAAYMAPEQARGKKVDKRADIWAFGVVLYEMVTGARPFQGADPTETMASVVTKEPNLDQAPVPLRRLLRKCLEKDPKKRLRDIADVWELMNESSEGDAAHAEAERRTATLPWILASVMGIVAVVVLLLWLKPLPSPQVFTFQIQAPPGSRLPLGTPAISDDGEKLAYTVVDPEGVTRIHVREFRSLDDKVLPGTEGAVHPFWSPRADSLAFAVGLKIKWINLASASPRDLLETGARLQGAWGKNDDILVNVGTGLSRVSSKGGAPAPIPGSSGTAFPTFLPDGRRYLVLVHSETGGSIQLATLGSTERALVLDNVRSAPILAVTPGGRTHLLYLDAADLMAQEFDQTSGKALGKSVVLVPHIGRVGIPAVRPTVGVSPSGILAYQKVDEAMTRRLKFVDRSGKPIRILPAEASVVGPRLSPDDLSIVGTRESGVVDIWQTDLERGVPNRKTFSDAIERSPVWSGDGTRLAFLRPGSGIFAMDVHGGGEQLLTEMRGGAPRDSMLTSSWGQYLAYISQGKIYLLNVAGDKKPIPIESPPGNTRSVQFSPDGKYIAFDSDSSGRYEVFVRPIASNARVTPVSIGVGAEPRWRGKELFFVSPDGDLMAAEIKLDDALSVGTPQKLFPLDGREAYGRSGYDVTRDGQRFLIPYKSEVDNVPITIVRNWWVELEKRPGR